MDRFVRFRPGTAALGLLAALAAAVGSLGPVTPAAAQPADARPVALRYVPHDAALVLHADLAQLQTHETVKAFRAADKNTFELLDGTLTKALGVPVAGLKSVTLFVPVAKQPEDLTKLGLAVTFAKPFDKKKLEDGLATELSPGAKVKVVALDPTTALVLSGLGDEYAKPRLPADDGPAVPAIKAAASGKHALVIGASFANLPDQLRGDDPPGQIRGLQPIFASDSLTATVTLGKSLDLDVRVKARRPAQAADAEKALGALAKLLGDELGELAAEFDKDAGKDMGLKDAVQVLKAIATSAKGAKYAVEGNEARMSASLPLAGLPLTSAYTATALKAQQAAALQRSANNLKQIALAMHNYHDTHDGFPPAAVCDKKGKPQLSWRVLILPYIEQDALYKEFKLDEPWDSEHNKKLIPKMPAVYALPGKTRPTDGETHYRVFVGNGAGFDWLTGPKFANITDGSSNTFLCATAPTAVPWTKPEELEFDPDKDPAKLIGQVVNGKAQVAMFDGSVRTLKKMPSKETLKALITRAGGEVVADDF